MARHAGALVWVALALVFAAGCGRSDLAGGGDCLHGIDPSGVCNPGPDGGFNGDGGRNRDGSGRDGRQNVDGGRNGDGALRDRRPGDDGGGADGFNNSDGPGRDLPPREICDNGVDDDGDGLVDCNDPDCFASPSCIVLGQEICNNGIDDNDNGLIDCADPECAGLPICTLHGEICDNGLDDDGDGAIDCADPDCSNAPNCQTQGCRPEVDFGPLAQRGASSTRSYQTLGHADASHSVCVAPGGGDIVATFQLLGPADVRLDWQQTGDHVFSLFAAGVNQACDQNPRGCFDTKAAPMGTTTLFALPAGTYYLITEAFAAGQEGSLTVTLSTGSATSPEICDNGIDDDGDGAIDCQDSDCANDPACQNQLCKVDLNLGAVVPDGPPQSGSLSTVGAGDDVHLSCAAGGGQDVTFRFSLPEPAVVAVDVTQTGDHVVGIFKDAGPGTRCDAGEGRCRDLEGEPMVRIIPGDFPLSAGVYYVVVDAQRPGAEGDVTVTVTALQNRRVELCDNGIDDDGNGLVDCDDPACFGVLGCAGGVCSPDENLGALPANTPVGFNVDTSLGAATEQLSCAMGGGKAQVVSFTLTEQSNVDVACMDTGDNVVGLFAAGGPRDRCDQSPVFCADLSISGGCNFRFPQLFAGTYYFIVEAFQSGLEGPLSGTLTAVPARTLEICDNGIDDDGDGLVDCDDPNCVGFPACVARTCHPDVALAALPIDGVARDLTLNTTGAGSADNVSCASSSGGGDRVIGFTLGRTATVHLGFGQFGNHDFGLFTNAGQGQPCDAKPLACQVSGGVANGTATFASLPAGDYFVVVKADAPGQEGPVAIRITATDG